MRFNYKDVVTNTGVTEIPEKVDSYTVDTSNPGYIEVQGIPPYAAGHAFTLTYMFENTSCSITSSPMSYIKTAMTTKPNGMEVEDYAKLQDLLRSLYNYSEAAKAYFESYPQGTGTGE